MDDGIICNETDIMGQKENQDRLIEHNLGPIGSAVPFADCNEVVDYFLIGVNPGKQLQDILNINSNN